MPVRLAPLTAGDLLLEPLVAAHAEAMYSLLSDTSLFRYIDEAPPVSIDALRQRYARLESRASADARQHWLNWVLRPQGGTPVGFVQATVEPDGECWIAYLLSQSHRGRGLATLAVRTMLPHVQQAYGAQRFLAEVEEANTPSLRLLARLGFSAASRQEHQRRGLEQSERLLVHEALRPPSP